MDNHSQSASPSMFVWQAFRGSGPTTSGAAVGLGPSVPVAGQPTGGSRYKGMLATTTSSSSSSSWMMTTTVPAQGPPFDIQQRHGWPWYPTPHQHQPVPLSSCTGQPLLPGPMFARAPADATLEHLSLSFRDIQSLCAALYDNLGTVQSDVKDVLSQLHALRTSQTKTDERIADIEGVIGHSTLSTQSGGYTRPHGRTDSPVDLDCTDPATVSKQTLVQSMASIQSAIDVLLARLPLSHPKEPSSLSLPDPSCQRLTLQSTQCALATFSVLPLESSTPLSSIAISTPDFTVSPPPTKPKKEYADVSTQAWPPYFNVSPVTPQQFADASRHSTHSLLDVQLSTSKSVSNTGVQTQESENACLAAAAQGSARLQVLMTNGADVSTPLFQTGLFALSGGGSSFATTTAADCAKEGSLEASSRSTHSSIPVVFLVNAPGPIAASSHGPLQVPRDVDADVDSSGIPEVRLSVGQPSITSLQTHVHAVDGSSLSSLKELSYDLRFSSSPNSCSSPPPLPVASPVLSDPSGLQHTQDEDEVWRSLMLGGSTPVSGTSSPHFSYALSRASPVQPHPNPRPQPLSVDPSVLHHPPLGGRGRGHERASARLPNALDMSLSPLSSLEDTDVEKGMENGGSKGRSDGSGSSQGRSRERHSEPRRTLSASRVASEANTGCVGGPGASLNELAMLARRQPFTIHLKLPGPTGTMKGVKRKRIRDVNGGDEGGDDDRESRGYDNDPDDDSMHADEVVQGERAGKTYTSVMPPTLTWRRSTWGKLTPKLTASQHANERAASKSSGDSGVKGADVVKNLAGVTVPTQTVSRRESESSRDGDSVDSVAVRSKPDEHTSEPRKRRKEAGHGRVCHKKPKRGSAVKSPETTVKYHVRNGQLVIVGAGAGPGPWSRAPEIGSISHLKEADQDAQTADRTRRQKERGNQARRKPLFLPSDTSYPGPSTPVAKQYPLKEDARSRVSSGGGTWPKLPSAFSQWDVQFIQCDKCNEWYHYGCAGIESGDPRLGSGVLFICPTCNTQGAKPQALANRNDVCARPDCPEPQVTADTEVYFVEKLVGRKKIEGYVFMWLAKWEGYPMDQATWIPKENVVGDGTWLFNVFSEDAMAEGADLSQDVVLLREARNGGWDSKGC